MMRCGLCITAEATSGPAAMYCAPCWVEQQARVKAAAKPETVVLSIFGGPVDPVAAVLEHHQRQLLLSDDRGRAIAAFSGIPGLADPPPGTPVH
jgi:hypothetical protein